MTGQGKPCFWQALSMATNISALAICAQFQVSKKCIPWTAAMAMWAASVTAFSGRARETGISVKGSVLTVVALLQVKGL